MTEWVEFIVGEGGTLSMSGTPVPEARYEVYEHIADDWQASAQDLFDAMDQCEPLAWAVHAIYEEVREQVESSLKLAVAQRAFNQPRINALAKRLSRMPDDPSEAAGEWLLALSDEEFDQLIVPVIRDWFDAAPDPIHETDYLPDTATPQGLAMTYWQQAEAALREALGVVIVEGEHPGSTYFAAELTQPVDLANQRALALKVPIRFV
mgnify:CR=1 FL=1